MTCFRFSRVAVLTWLFAISASSVSLSAQSTGDRFPSDRLRLGVQVLDRKYCKTGNEGLPTLRFTLLFQFKNITSGSLTFNHVGTGDAIYVGKSVKDIYTGKYEPGSQLPDSLGHSLAKGWQADGRTVASGKALEIRTKNVWISLAMNKEQRELGASPGRHFLQVFGTAEISDDTHGPATVLLSSVPASFVVDSSPKFEGCD